ncbi:MAG TPA: 2OG-Fe(II) oxygenase [Bryobacterales bacterium]|nr:2OG-Fe(II) oxygenase [Bryobacterales bacterium]
MPNASFFTRFHLFVVRGFFDAAACAALRAQMQTAAGRAAPVWVGDNPSVVKPTIRKAKLTELPGETVSDTTSRLLALKPQLEQHFGLTLQGCQPLQFLTYRVGDFYRWHTDGANESDGRAVLTARRVSTVIFLNSEAEEPHEGAYCGGSLAFHELMNHPRGGSLGFPLIGEEGLLIAFPPSLPHEVTPVTHGERYTIATWYF